MSIDHQSTTIQMPYRTFRQMEQTIQERDARIRELENQSPMKGATIPNEQEVVNTIQHAIKVIQFAISELDPATVRGWPHEALYSFGQGLRCLMTLPSMREFGDNCVSFAAECRHVDEFRERRREEAKAILAVDEG